MKNKCVAIIGGAGFLGSNLSNYLSKANKVLVLDNLSVGKLEYLEPEIIFQRFDIRYSPIRLSKLLKDFKADFVFHLASCPFIPESSSHPEEFIDVNIRGTHNVLKACQEAEIKRILIYSSSEVYGGGLTRNFKINEEFQTFPRSTYSTTKLAQDRLSYNFFKEHGLPVIILRLFNTYGSNFTHPYIIPEIMKQLEKSFTLKLGNLEACRDFLYVEDQVKMVTELMEKGKPGEIYNLGSGKNYSVKEIAYLCSKIIHGKRAKIIIDSQRLRPDEVRYLLSDNSKIYKVIKARPTIPFEEGLKKTYAWFKKHKEIFNSSL